MVRSRSVSEVCQTLDSSYASTEELGALLNAADEAIVLAAVLHLDRRLRAGDSVDAWQNLLPVDVFTMPAESQLALAALAVDGFWSGVPDAPDTLAPFVRLAWRRAELLERPSRLPAWANR